MLLWCLYWYLVSILPIGLPQQPLVVTRTTCMGYGFNRSTFHHGDASFSVSVHCFPSWTVVFWPSLALPAPPPRTDVDWLAGFLKAMLVPETRHGFLDSNAFLWISAFECGWESQGAQDLQSLAKLIKLGIAYIKTFAIMRNSEIISLSERTTLTSKSKKTAYKIST